VIDDPQVLGLLLAWGTLVGLDLVSVPQAMISRPLVAGTVAGAILGDPASGLAVGAVLELFALEVLPVGAVRYPDFGPAAIAGVGVAAGTAGLHGTGFAVTIGMVVAYVGDSSIQLIRRYNAGAVRRRVAQLEAGDPRTVALIQRLGLARDAFRAFALTAFGLALAIGARFAPPLTGSGATLLDVVVIGAGLAAAGSGALRLSGSGSTLAWLAAGGVAGTLLVVLR
jgi:PTS system mannose-specific IIC component